MTSEKKSFSLGLRQISGNIILTFGRQFIAGLLQLGIILFIARVLGTAAVGGYSLSLLMPMLLATFLNLGLNSANVYFIASRQFSVEVVWVSCKRLITWVGIAGLFIGSLVIVFLGSVIFPGVEVNHLLIGILIFPLVLTTGIITSLFQGLEDFKSFNILALIQPSFAMFLVSTLWFFSLLNLTNVLLATFFSQIVVLVAGIWLLSKNISILNHSLKREDYLRVALRYGIKTNFGNFATFLSNRADLFLVNFFIGPSAAGLYSVAVRLVEQLWIISQAVSTVLFPRLSGMYDDEKGRSELTPLIARLVFWITLFAAGVVAGIVEPLIAFLVGDEFSDASSVVFVLLPGIVFLSCARVLANDLASRGLVGINLTFAIGILVMNVVGNIVFIPAYGILGAAMSTSMAYGLNLLIRVFLQQRITKVCWWYNIVPQLKDYDQLKSVIFNKKGKCL